MPKLLVVDDQSQIRRLLSLVLAKEFDVLEAENGASALATIYREKPRGVLLDVMMPGAIDGLQVLDAIKMDDALLDTRVAIISARGQVVDLEAARRRGADAYFVKPFSPARVVEWVREQLA